MANTPFTPNIVARAIATAIAPHIENARVVDETKPPSASVEIEIADHSMSMSDFVDKTIKPAAKTLADAIDKKPSATFYLLEVPAGAHNSFMGMIGTIPIRVIPLYDIDSDATKYRISIAHY